MATVRVTKGAYQCGLGQRSKVADGVSASAGAATSIASSAQIFIAVILTLVARHRAR